MTSEYRRSVQGLPSIKASPTRMEVGSSTGVNTEAWELSLLSPRNGKGKEVASATLRGDQEHSTRALWDSPPDAPGQPVLSCAGITSKETSEREISLGQESAAPSFRDNNRLNIEIFYGLGSGSGRSTAPQGEASSLQRGYQAALNYSAENDDATIQAEMEIIERLVKQADGETRAGNLDIAQRVLTKALRRYQGLQTRHSGYTEDIIVMSFRLADIQSRRSLYEDAIDTLDGISFMIVPDDRQQSFFEHVINAKIKIADIQTRQLLDNDARTTLNEIPNLVPKDEYDLYINLIIEARLRIVEMQMAQRRYRAAVITLGEISPPLSDGERILYQIASTMQVIVSSQITRNQYNDALATLKSIALVSTGMAADDVTFLGEYIIDTRIRMALSQMRYGMHTEAMDILENTKPVVVEDLEKIEVMVIQCLMKNEDYRAAMDKASEILIRRQTLYGTGDDRYYVLVALKGQLHFLAKNLDEAEACFQKIPRSSIHYQTYPIRSLLTPSGEIKDRKHAMFIAAKGSMADLLIIQEKFHNKSWIVTRGDGLLHIAASHGNTPAAREIILRAESDKLLSAKNRNGSTPLHCAVAQGHYETVMFLCNSGASVNSTNGRDKGNLTPLHIAINKNHAEIAAFLCDKGADTNARAVDQSTALYFAVQNDQADIIKLLCRKGANLNLQSRGGLTALHAAVQYHRLEIVSILADEKADLNAKTSDGFTPLHFAAIQGRSSTMTKLLSERGAIPSPTPSEPMNETTKELIKRFAPNKRRWFSMLVLSR